MQNFVDCASLSKVGVAGVVSHSFDNACFDKPLSADLYLSGTDAAMFGDGMNADGRSHVIRVVEDAA